MVENERAKTLVDEGIVMTAAEVEFFERIEANHQRRFDELSKDIRELSAALREHGKEMQEQAGQILELELGMVDLNDKKDGRVPKAENRLDRHDRIINWAMGGLYVIIALLVALREYAVEKLTK